MDDLGIPATGILTEIRLACSASAWGRDGFVDAVSAVSSIGYDGVECSARLVIQYEDRLHVFEEILDISKLRLSAMTQYADFINRETADETVERVANTARFLGAIDTTVLLVTLANRDDDELEMGDDDWTTVAAILEEMGARCKEFGIQLALRPRSGFLCGSDQDMKKILGMVNEDTVKLCCDTAELTLADISIERFFKNYGNRIIYVRSRDASGAKRREDVTSTDPGTAPQFGRGAVDFPKVSRILAKSGYTGWVTVDVAGEGSVPRSAADAAFRYMMRKSELFL